MTESPYSLLRSLILKSLLVNHKDDLYGIFDWLYLVKRYLFFFKWTFFVFSKYDSDVTEESDNNRSAQSENKRDDPMVDLFPDDDHEDNRNNKCRFNYIKCLFCITLLGKTSVQK